MDYLVEANVAVLWKKKNIAPKSNHFKRVLKKTQALFRAGTWIGKEIN